MFDAILNIQLSELTIGDVLRGALYLYLALFGLNIVSKIFTGKKVC